MLALFFNPVSTASAFAAMALALVVVCIGVCKFMPALAMRWTKRSSRNSVLHIFKVCASVDMIWSNAKWIIASVARFFAFWDRPDGNFVSVSVSCNQFSVDFELTVHGVI